ncbi:membrane protein insertion efficiency factor YidD [Granulicoccus phenolivorans]|uniref:membrane protein insertion efficiency factor YidD n=1 Tax=Granulicoccus phenolivorans TaxID=266854 RepID=UPI00042890ED|nr:membrane protein insertion efficiency factor YidD [Granulicoccus phenolivorans]
MKWWRDPLKWLMIAFIRAWRAVISPLYGNVCRYYPSCSAYGLEAVHVHGSIKGGGLTIWRIMRCNPWSSGGYDPVPGTPAAEAWAAEQAERAAAADSLGVASDQHNRDRDGPQSATAAEPASPNQAGPQPA